MVYAKTTLKLPIQKCAIALGAQRKKYCARKNYHRTDNDVGFEGNKTCNKLYFKELN